jgi:hypothetical protein
VLRVAQALHETASGDGRWLTSAPPCPRTPPGPHAKTLRLVWPPCPALQLTGRPLSATATVTVTPSCSESSSGSPLPPATVTPRPPPSASPSVLAGTLTISADWTTYRYSQASISNYNAVQLGEPNLMCVLKFKLWPLHREGCACASECAANCASKVRRPTGTAGVHLPGRQRVPVAYCTVLAAPLYANGLKLPNVGQS